MLLPPGDGGEVTIVLRCAEYAWFHPEGAKKTTRPYWKRVPHPLYEVTLPLDPEGIRGEYRIAELPGIAIEATLGTSSTPQPGTRALSVFVVNERAPDERGKKDAQYLFQVSLEVRHAAGFLAGAVELGRLCSNDPVCATHLPHEDHAERYLEGAACHGCLYLAEVSCERMNRMLDRALVVPVIDQPRELAFFEVE